MDHASEQQMEVEALEAIFADELEEYTGISTGPEWPAVGKTYKLEITPREEGEDDDGEDPLEMELIFAHTAQYPEEAPCLRVQAVYGLSDSDVAACRCVHACSHGHGQETMPFHGLHAQIAPALPSCMSSPTCCLSVTLDAWRWHALLCT
jgi:hypothetical protein